MTVKILPPKESFNILVNLESLYGTNLPVFDFSDNMFKQFPKVNKLLFILTPSSLRFPLSKLRSLPAKSTTKNLL